jgi:hypothetical protein
MAGFVCDGGHVAEVQNTAGAGAPRLVRVLLEANTVTIGRTILAVNKNRHPIREMPVVVAPMTLRMWHFEDHSLVVFAAVVGDAIEIAFGIKHQIAVWMAPLVAAAEIAEHGLFPVAL